MTGADPFERLVDTVLGGAGAKPVWGQRQRGITSRGFNERQFAKRLREYWGADADPMRVRLAQEDARFVAGVVHMVGDELRLSNADRRRVATAVTRDRLLGESDPSLAEVDAAWRAWWPPAPGPQARDRAAEFLRAWRDWLEHAQT